LATDKDETGNPPPTANASDFYPNQNPRSGLFNASNLRLNNRLMPDKTEKAHRKELQRRVREDARGKVLDSLPVPAPVLKALFDYLDGQLESSECDDTLRHVRDFSRGHSLPEESIVSWLEDNGGHCDCEALAN